MTAMRGLLRTHLAGREWVYGFGEERRVLRRACGGSGDGRVRFVRIWDDGRDERRRPRRPDPDGLPQPVPHVGEKAAYNSDASWIPALRSLLAVRGNRWLTVTISVAGRTDAQLLAQAAVLARAGFKLSAGG